jgi:hypothetical protein
MTRFGAVAPTSWDDGRSVIVLPGNGQVPDRTVSV